jgi:hypothetical protein
VDVAHNAFAESVRLTESRHVAPVLRLSRPRRFAPTAHERRTIPSRDVFRSSCVGSPASAADRPRGVMWLPPSRVEHQVTDHTTAVRKETR